MSAPRPPGPATATPAALPLASVLENLAAEIRLAEVICLSVEEIVAVRLKAGAADSAAARVELQNLDRLIQMLTDFRTLLTHLGTISDGALVDAEAAGAHLVMDELRRRLLSAQTQGHPPAATAPSEVTFF